MKNKKLFVKRKGKINWSRYLRDGRKHKLKKQWRVTIAALVSFVLFLGSGVWLYVDDSIRVPFVVGIFIASVLYIVYAFYFIFKDINDG